MRYRICTGYRLPIGGVTAPASPGGGRLARGRGFWHLPPGRLLAADLAADELASVFGRVMDRLVAAILRAGPDGVWRLAGWAEMDKLLADTLTAQMPQLRHELS